MGRYSLKLISSNGSDRCFIAGGHRGPPKILLCSFFCWLHRCMRRLLGRASLIPVVRSIGVRREPGRSPNRTSYCTTTACNTSGDAQSDRTCSGGTVTATTIMNAVNSASSGQVVRIPSGSFSLAGVTVGEQHLCARGRSGPNVPYSVWGECRVQRLQRLHLCLEWGWQLVGSSGQWPDRLDRQVTARAKRRSPSPASRIEGRDSAHSRTGRRHQQLRTGWLNCGSQASLCQQGASNSQWNGWTEAQTVQVTSCGASTPGAACTSGNVTFTPGLHAPNWTASKTPKAWWPSTTPITGVGIEDLSLDCHSQTTTCVTFWGASDSWYIGSRTNSSGSNHVGLRSPRTSPSMRTTCMAVPGRRRVMVSTARTAAQTT